MGRPVTLRALFDHLAHAKAFSRPDVIELAFTGHDGFESLQVRIGQVVDVNKIANAGAVGRGIICSEDRHMWTFSESDVEDDRDDVGLGRVVFTERTILGGSTCVEVTKRDKPHSVCRGEVAHGAFAGELGEPVGIDRVLGRVFVDWASLGNAVGGRGAGEDQFGHAHRAHGLEDVDRSYEIVDIIFRRVFDALGHARGGGEVHDGFDVVVCERRFEQALVGEVADSEQAFRHGLEVANREVVVDLNIVSGLHEQAHGVAADIACSSNDEYIHGCYVARNVEIVCPTPKSSKSLDLVAEEIEGFTESDGPLDRWIPAQEGLRSRNIRLASFRVVLGQFAEDDLAFRSWNHGLDFLGELENGDFGGVADVHWLGEIAEEEPVDAVDEVGYVAETSGLITFPEDGQRLSSQDLTHEGRQDSAVVQTHPRPVCVEDADDMGFDSVVPVVGHRDGFGKAFGLVVAASGTDRVDVAPVILALGVNLGVAVDLGGACQKESRVFGFGESKGVVGAERSDLERGNRVLQVVGWACGASEMEHIVDGPVDQDGFRDVVLEKLELGQFEKMSNVSAAACQQVV